MRIGPRIWLTAAFCLAGSALAVHDGRSADAPAQAGLQIQTVDIDANQDSPTACIVFSEALARQSAMPLDGFFTAEPAAKLTIAADGSKACLSGFDFGVAYTVSVKSGLPGVAHALAGDSKLHILMPN